MAESTRSISFWNVCLINSWTMIPIIMHDCSYPCSYNIFMHDCICLCSIFVPSDNLSINVKGVFLTLCPSHSRFANIVAIPLLVFHGTFFKCKRKTITLGSKEYKTLLTELCAYIFFFFFCQDNKLCIVGNVNHWILKL